MINQTFLRNELLDLQIKSDELDSENIKLTKENEKYELENKKLRSKISELNEQLFNTVDRKEFDDLTNKYENLTERFENLDKNFKRIKKDNETLNNTYDHCQKNYNDLEVKFEICKKENAELKINISELKTISKQTLKDAKSKSEEIEEQNRLISLLEEENESLKNHINYFKEQNKRNTSAISCDSFTAFDQLNNNSVTSPESLGGIFLESRLKEYEQMLEDEKLRSKTQIDELKKQKSDLQSDYDQLLESNENKDSKLIDLESENVKLKIELNNQTEQITKLEGELNSLNERLKDKNDQLVEQEQQLKMVNEQLIRLKEELDIERLAKQNDLMNLISENDQLKLELNKLSDEIKQTNETNNSALIAIENEKETIRAEKERILVERDELENQFKELKQNLINLKDEQKLLIKKHQEEIFRLSETMIKKEDESRLQTDLQNAYKELKIREDQLIKFKTEIEKYNESKQTLLIQIEKLKANERERNHSIYMMKQEMEKQIRSYEIELKKLSADLKCAEDSFTLERKTKERFYRELTELERRKEENKCIECTKLARSNSLTFNAKTQLLTVKSASNQIQKLPNPNMMEEEEGQFMTTVHLNDVRKRKTEHNDQDDYKKRINVLQQRNSKVPPHLKTSYALEYQELGGSVLNEKIKNSEKISVNENTNSTKNPLLSSFSSLRFRKT